MNNTLVVYEGKYGTAKKTAESLGYIIGNTKVVKVDEAPKDLKAYQNVVMVFSFYGYDTLKETMHYIEAAKESLTNKKVAVVGIGLAQKDLANYLKIIQKELQVKEELAYFIPGDLCLKKLSKEDAEALKRFSQKIKMPITDCYTWKMEQVAEVGSKLVEALKVWEKPMPKEALKKEIDHFIIRHNMMALSTGSGTYERCSPIEYIYRHGCFYIITEGGNKFRGLLQNPQVSVGIYDEYKGMNQLGGLQIMGMASIVPYRSETYLEMMNQKGVKEQALSQLAIELYMVEIKPISMEFLYSPLKQQGYDAKQRLLLG